MRACASAAYEVVNCNLPDSMVCANSVVETRFGASDWVDSGGQEIDAPVVAVNSDDLEPGVRKCYGNGEPHITQTDHTDHC